MTSRNRMELGRCKFCGKEQGVWAESRSDADHDVTEACDCQGAVRMRRFEKLYDSIDGVLCDKMLDSTDVKTIKYMCGKFKEIEVAAQKRGA